MSSEGAARAIPSGGRAAGVVTVPSSKSATHRAFNLALLARAPIVIERPLLAEDTHLFLEALRRCGFRVALDEATAEARLEPGPLPKTAEIHCGNAGTMLRFLTAALTTQAGEWILDGSARLRERPVGPLVAALRQLGAKIEYLGEEGGPPLRVFGATLRGGSATLDASESSQYLSALLMAALRAEGAVEVRVSALTSAPYVDLTLEAMAGFGAGVRRPDLRVFAVEPQRLHAGRIAVEGDYSAACYPAAAAALTLGRVVLRGLRADSRQGDRRFLDLLQAMGARVSTKAGAAEEVEVEGGALTAIDADLSAMPDQVPTLAALAPFARGVSRIHEVAHLRIKESDRLASMAAGLRAAGAEVEELPSGLLIPGGWADRRPPNSEVRIDPHGDHRIAMSFALLGLRRPGITIERPEVVGKSYPSFWRDLGALVPGWT